MVAKLNKTERAELTAMIGAYEAARSALVDRLKQIASDWDDEIFEKGNRWQRSAIGEEARVRVDQMESWADELPASFEIDMDKVS